jgi:23S rRNA (cytidine1920-2'-O)/16S rRNA (cytidine1409-2'-O)-methyltransferase
MLARTLAQRLIAAGSVWVDDGSGARAVIRASEVIAPGSALGVDAADPSLRYVSRGGLKLEPALARLRALGLQALTDRPHSPDPGPGPGAPGAGPPDDSVGLVALDIGLSTGGFADCLLSHGVQRVVGIDVGHGQLHPRLAADPRVRSFEGLNARALDASILGDAMPASGFGLATIDVSFIALDAVLPAVVALIGECGWLVALVKPQFELGPAARDRHGIVRDSRLYGPLLDRLAASCQALNCTVRETLESPLRGGDGNREFLLIAQKNSVC